MNLPDVQLFLRPGIVEFGWGNPDADLLPAADVARAAEIALQRSGRQALSYGAEQGPGRLIQVLQGWFARQEGASLAEQQLFVTGGVSQALDLICTLFTRPGDVALVESPVYHLALRIFRDHGLELVPVTADEDGLRIDVLAEVLDSLRLQDRYPRFLYTVPTFNNPTGMTMAAERRHALVALAQRAELLVLEDDVCRALWFDAPPPPSLYALAPAGPIVRLGSFSKILAPGLRLGWLSASPEFVQRCVRSGLLDSGGGVSHFAAHVVAEFIELGLLDAHVERLRAAYGRRRDCLLDALARWLPSLASSSLGLAFGEAEGKAGLASMKGGQDKTACSWRTPGGGFFVWLRLPEGYDSGRFLSDAEAAGVSYVPGSRFYVGAGGERFARLAFSLVSLQELEEGARRLASALGPSVS
jgi:2-aminoadipate transaminase